MTKDDFVIGGEFICGEKRWRCTDIGTRVVTAICVEFADISTMTEGETTTRRIGGAEAEADGWFRGPPYAVVERVFDEDDQEACEIASWR